MPRPGGTLAPGRKDDGQVGSGGLVDAQGEAIGDVRWRAARHRHGKALSRVREPMRQAGRLCRDQRRPRRLRFTLPQLVREHLETIECGEVARELRRQLLLLDDRLGDSRLLGRAPEPIPGALPCAFQVDGGDVPCRC